MAVRGTRRLFRDGWWHDLLPAGPAVAFVLICCVPVLGWMLWQIVSRPALLADVIAQQWPIVLSTVCYNLLAAALAVVVAIPAAMVIGRGRNRFALPLLFVLGVGLLQPSIVYAYGWVQIFRIADLFPRPQSMLDILRCVLTLAGWLWPIPAVLMGLTLRRMDPQIQQQALLDGAVARVTLRHLAGSMVASACIVMVLALQEFSIYDYSGIQVVPTEVRALFQSTTDPTLGAGRALATALPTIALVVLLAVAGVHLLRDTGGEMLAAGRWPRVLDAGVGWYVLTAIVVVTSIVVPIAALIGSMQRPFAPAAVWGAFGPEMVGSTTLAAVAGALTFVVALSASLVRVRFGLLLASLLFLAGGQMVAVALIRLYNRPWLDWIYNQWPIVILADLALFGWVALAGGRLTWSQSWRQLREISAVDGASRWQVGRYVVWPLAWPVCGAAAVLVAVLSLGEVPAAVLLQVQRPPTIIPWLVTWVHMQRSDEMIQGSLLLLGLVMALSAVALGLAYLATRRFDRHRLRRQRMRGEPISSVQMFSTIALGLLACFVGGCDDGVRPQAIWCDTGTGLGQVVYPRAIAYSRNDQSYFIVDRLARIQHLDRRGQAIREWRMPEWEHGKPVGLTVGPDGNLWVPDTHYHRVMVYSPQGQLLKQFGTFGKEPGQFILPTDVAFDSAGNVFVSEYGDNDRIQVFDQHGNVLRQIGRFGQGDGEFARPQSMVIIGDTLYVTDACNHRIVVFRTDGTFVRNIGSVGTGLGQFRFPYGLDVDSQGRLVVCEFGNNRVQLIDPDTGEGLRVWGTAGREPGELAYPWGVAVGEDDRIVAVDAGNNRLQVFTF